MTSKVTDRDFGFKDLLGALDDLKGEISVLVGVPGTADEYKDGANQVMIASVHEFGADIKHPGGTPYVLNDVGQARFVKKGHADPAGVTKAHIISIPERSFLRSTVDEKSNDYAALLAKLVGQVVDGKITPTQALDRLGLTVERDVKRKIVEIKEPPNAASTIRMKKSSNPLIDTGQLRQSITYEIRKEAKS